MPPSLPSVPPSLPFVFDATLAVVSASIEQRTATVTAAVAASVAVSVTASATASASTGGALPALLAAQRFSMYGGLGGGGSGIAERACASKTANPLMGQFGVASWFSDHTAQNASCEVAELDSANLTQQRRQLQSGRRERAGEDSADRSNQVQFHLLFLLGDTVGSLVVLMLFVVALQTLILAYYGFRVNRRYYRALASGAPAKKLPIFRALPSSFVFPHMQLLLLMSFASGLTTNTVSVYGVNAAGLTISTVLYAFSLSTSVLLVAFLAWQLLAVVRFHLAAGKALWVAEPPVESVDEMDDPLLRLLARLKLMRPRMRGRGEYAPAEDAMAEPARTQRALRRAMTWGGILECLPWIRKRQVRAYDGGPALAVCTTFSPSPCVPALSALARVCRPRLSSGRARHEDPVIDPYMTYAFTYTCIRHEDPAIDPSVGYSAEARRGSSSLVACMHTCI